MNIQLHHIVSDVTGATGLRIVRAIVEGERDAEDLSRMTDSALQPDEHEANARRHGPAAEPQTRNSAAK